MEQGTTLGDHRPIWIDVSISSALGSKLPELQVFQAMRLKYNDPRIVECYNNLLEKNLKEQKFFTRLKRLYDTYSVPLTSQQQDEIEELDGIQEIAMIRAERKCRKLKMGKVAWTPELERIIQTIRYYNVTIRKKSGRKVSARLLMRFIKEDGFVCADENN